MTNQEILTKAIKKAEKNGFDSILWINKNYMIDPTKRNPYKTAIEDLLTGIDYKLLLTDHEFAKAFFGDYPMCFSCDIQMTESQHKTSWYCPKCKCLYGKYDPKSGAIDYEITWQSHLQQMVITDNWLEYIKGFLED